MPFGRRALPITSSVDRHQQMSLGQQAGGMDFPMRVKTYFEQLQSRICSALESVEGSARFGSDAWERPGGGGGLSRVLEEGDVLEKAGVGVSTVFGDLPRTMASRMKTATADFWATGISLVVHPRNPYAPAVHMNYRYFQEGGNDFWFGGGSDLTPNYLYEEDAVHFHSALKRACDSVDGSYYPRFKKACDEYFTIKHRKETRGIGGIFFDDLRGDPEKLFALARAGGDVFLESYLPLVERRNREAWGDRERRWQLLRRGRYVEFNLVYDRGTTFGLETQGRVESILMSLPPHADWRYMDQPRAGTREAALVEVLQHPREWVR